MAADAGGGYRPRLRLRRRRPPSEAGAPDSVPRPPSGRPWFLQETGSGSESESAEPWAELLRTLLPGMDLSTAPPPLPAFPLQEPRRDPKHTAPVEVFTVGGKDFPWTPFPPAPGRGTRSSCLLRGIRGRPGSPAPSAFRHPEPEPGVTPIAKEQTSVEEKPPSVEEKPPSVEEKPPSVKEVPALVCCPMCQAEFSTKLSQLDIDAHLAQCLAESTADVVW
ncbi:Fanconi anemia core complex-associated protein 20 [Trichechus inunguis]